MANNGRNQTTAHALKGGPCQVGEFAANGATPQTKAAVHAAAAATGATSTTPFGFTTAAQANDLVTLVNQMRQLLIDVGLAV